MNQYELEEFLKGNNVKYSIEETRVKEKRFILRNKLGMKIYIEYYSSGDFYQVQIQYGSFNSYIEGKSVWIYLTEDRNCTIEVINGSIWGVDGQTESTIKIGKV